MWTETNDNDDNYYSWMIIICSKRLNLFKDNPYNKVK